MVIFKNTKTGPCSIIGAHLEPVATHDEAIEMLKNTKTKYVYINLKERMCYSMKSMGITSHYVPATSSLADSVFATNQVAIGLSKHFPYVKEFNHM